MSIRIQDGINVQLKGTRKLQDGYLVTEAFSARTGVQFYRGVELGLKDRDIVRVYRPESEVRDAAAMQSFSHAPITLGHPPVDVDASNWKDYAVGEVSTEAVWKDNKIKMPLIIKDAAAIAALEGGTRELSPGYRAEIVLQDGITEDGEPYDAIQKNIRINHLAIVKRGRSGQEVRIGDADNGESLNWGVAPIQNAELKEETMNLQTVLVDGLSVETTEAGAQAIKKLQTAIKDADGEAAKLAGDKDRRIAELEAEIDDLKSKSVKDSDIDALIASRSDLIGRAKTVVKDANFDGLSELDIRKKVLVAKLGDAAIEGKSNDYIEARFDGVVEAASNRKADPIMAKLGDAKTVHDAADSWGPVLRSQGYIE